MIWRKGSGRGVGRNAHMREINEMAYNYVPQYKKQRTLQKNQLGTVIVNGMLLLILDTIKNALSKYISISTNN